MSELNNSNNSEKEPNLNKTNDEFTQKIFELELIIKEKEEIIYTLHSKIKEFSMNFEQLKIENEKLKTQIKFIEKEINKNKPFFNSNSLQMQQTQRFVIYKEIYNNSFNNNKDNDYLNFNTFKLINNDNSFNLYTEIQNEFINENFKSRIIPFQMVPFKTFDHKKLETSNSIIKNNKEGQLLNEDNFIENNINDKNIYIKNKINDNISLLEKDFKKELNYNQEKIYNNDYSNINNVNNISYNNKNKNGKKLHSSMFFQNCKKIISKNEYKKLLEIVKLSNLKKISKEETYLKITSLLDDRYPQLSNEFKLLFI